jgi:hypothetical protein
MTKPPPSDSDVELLSAPVNQRIQRATDTQSSSANGQSKIPKLDPKQNIPASVSTPANQDLGFFDNYINPNLPRPESHPLLTLYRERTPEQIISNKENSRD